jgi:hypothetical protein
MKMINHTMNIKFPTFLKGFASAFDITRQSLLDIPDFNTGFQRDAEALRKDWIIIGRDMRKSMERLAHE